MRSARMSVYEPLQIATYLRVGRRVAVRVVDDRRRGHSIVFSLASAAEARSRAVVMGEWLRARTPLAYVRGAKTSALVDVAALFARAVYASEEPGNAQ